MRSSLLEENPWIARSLFDAFDASRKLTEERRLALADTTPWLLPDIERTAEILGPDWQISGVEPNRPMIETFSTELHAQGIIGQPLDPDSVFQEFLRLTAMAGPA